MDINERREALRARVRQQLHPEPEEEEELVVQASEITNSTTEGEELLLIEEQNGILALASSLIFIGSVLGIITGLLLLQEIHPNCSTSQQVKMSSMCMASFLKPKQVKQSKAFT